MKISCIIGLIMSTCRCYIEAFTFVSKTSKPIFPRTTSLASDFASDFGSAMPTLTSPYERIGIQEAELALGVSAEEFLMYFGTKEDLISKTMEDIPKYSREEATKAVEWFMLDKEAIDFYVAYEKKKAEDPEFGVEKKEGFFSFRTLVIVYITYVVSSTILLPQVRNYIAGQEAAGTWQPTNIPFIDNWIANTAVPVSSSGVAETVQAIADTIQSSGALQ